MKSRRIIAIVIIALVLGLAGIVVAKHDAILGGYYNLTTTIPPNPTFTTVTATTGTFSNLVVSVFSSTTLSKFGDGTVLAPAITFVADTDTGIYRAGTNQFGITAGGLNGLTVSSTGSFMTTGTITNGTITTATFTNATSTNLYVSGVSNLLSITGNANLTSITSTNSYSASYTGNANLTSVTSTNLYVSSLGVFAGSMTYSAVTTNNSTLSLTGAHYFVKCDATSAAVTSTLPTAVGVTGRTYIIKKVDSSANACVVSSTLGQTIDDSPSALLITTPSSSINIISDGANWLLY